MYTSQTTSKMSLSLKENWRRNRVFFKGNIHKAQKTVCVQAQKGTLSRAEVDKHVDLSCNSKGLNECTSICCNYLVLSSSSKRNNPRAVIYSKHSLAI